MATRTDQLSRASGATWVKGGVAGLIAGLVFAMWAMIVGTFTPGSNLLAAPQGIAQSIGIGAQGHDIQLVPLLVGLMGHMMNSVIFGLLFVGILAALKLRGNNGGRRDGVRPCGPRSAEGVSPPAADEWPLGFR